MPLGWQIVVVTLQDRPHTLPVVAVCPIGASQFLSFWDWTLCNSVGCRWTLDRFQGNYKKYQFEKDIDDCAYWTDWSLFSLYLASNPRWATDLVLSKLDSEPLHKAVESANLDGVGKGNCTTYSNRTLMCALPLWAK